MAELIPYVRGAFRAFGAAKAAYSTYKPIVKKYLPYAKKYGRQLEKALGGIKKKYNRSTRS